MKRRYVDNIKKQNVDFISRNYVVSRSTLYTAVVLLSLFVFLNYLLSDTDNVFAFFSFVFVSLSCLISVKMHKDYNKVIDAAEFQNLLFTNALKSDTSFCIIFRDDGSLLYADRKFFEICDKREIVVDSIQDFLKLGSVSDEDKEEFNIAIQNNREATICSAYNLFLEDKGIKLTIRIEPFEVKKSVVEDGSFYLNKSHLKLAPMPRPHGYFLIKAVEHTDNRKLYHSLLNSHSVGIIQTDNDGMISDVNEYIADCLKYRASELVGKRYIYQIAKDLKDCYPNCNLLTRKKTAFIAGDGSYLDMTVTSISYEKNVCENVICFILNVDKGDERQNDNSISDRFSEYFEKAPIPLGLFSVSGDLIRVNNAFSRLSGCDNYDAYEKKIKLTAFVSEKSVSVIDAGFTSIIANRAINFSDIEWKNGAMSRIFISYVNDTILGCFIDNNENKDLVMQLQHSQKMQAVGQLAGGIAHDFNNILTAIVGFCDLLLSRHLPGDTSFPDIMQIKQNTNRATTLVRQLLAFSSKQTLQPEIVNINEILTDLVHLIRRLIGENISLKIDYATELWDCYADKGQIEQIVINLVVNARDAIGDIGCIEVSTKNLAPGSFHTDDMFSVDDSMDDLNREYVLVSISDTGSGIDSDIMGKIFDPFFSTKDINKGSGLGLSTVYGIMKQSGGCIYVASEKGKGTIFYLLFPKFTDFPKSELGKLYGDNAVVTENTIESVAAKGTTASELSVHEDLTGNETILLVEDEISVSKFISIALGKKGYNVIVASTGTEGIELFKSNNDIALILTDVVLPDMSGPDFIDNADIKDVNVVFMSGHAEDAFRKKYGVDRDFNFLSKPFTLNTLIKTVKMVIAESKY